MLKRFEQLKPFVEYTFYTAEKVYIGVFVKLENGSVFLEDLSVYNPETDRTTSVASYILLASKVKRILEADGDNYSYYIAKRHGVSVEYPE